MSPINTSFNSLRFGVRHDMKRQADRKADRLQDQFEKDAAFLEKRSDWFEKNRPGDSKEEGYVTTPGHSDDEYESDNGTKPRPSARKRARETGRDLIPAIRLFVHSQHSINRSSNSVSFSEP